MLTIKRHISKIFIVIFLISNIILINQANAATYSIKSTLSGESEVVAEGTISLSDNAPVIYSGNPLPYLTDFIWTVTSGPQQGVFFSTPDLIIIEYDFTNPNSYQFTFFANKRLGQDIFHQMLANDSNTSQLVTQEFMIIGETKITDYMYDHTITLVPLPATVWFMGTGLLCLLGMSRKK